MSEKELADTVRRVLAEAVYDCAQPWKMADRIWDHLELNGLGIFRKTTEDGSRDIVPARRRAPEVGDFTLPSWHPREVGPKGE
jgi:hypothetical protein